MRSFQDLALRNLENDEAKTKTTLVSKNITVCGRRTSVRLEPEMWNALRDIAKREKCTIHDICSLISMRKNEKSSLTASIRVFLMLYFRAATTEEGHIRAGHGNFRFMAERAKIPNNGVSKFKSQIAAARGQAQRDDVRQAAY